MSTFTVRWEEDIEADSPRDAIDKAWALLTERPELVFFTISDRRGGEMEMDVVTGQVRTVRHQIPEHKHDFVGDQDTCVGYLGCPVTWAEWKARKQ